MYRWYEHCTSAEVILRFLFFRFRGSTYTIHFFFAFYHFCTSTSIHLAFFLNVCYGWFWAVSGVAATCVFVSAVAASFAVPPQYVDCHSSYLLLLLRGPTCCLGHRHRPGHKATSLPSTYLGDLLPSVRSSLHTSLEHMRAHVSTRLDRGQT